MSVVRIYRAQPATTITIRTNDFVTRSLRFAGEHAVTSAIYNGEPFFVVRAYVDSRLLKEDLNPGEFRYTGPPVEGQPYQIADEETGELTSALHIKKALSMPRENPERGPTIEVNHYGSALDVPEDDLEMLEAIFDDGDVGQYFTEDVVALARDADGDVIGGITESNGDELTIAVAEHEQGQGIGLAMIKALIAAGGGGFMVAGTDAGLEFITSLYDKLSEEERESIDASSWADLEAEREAWEENPTSIWTWTPGRALMEMFRKESPLPEAGLDPLPELRGRKRKKNPDDDPEDDPNDDVETRWKKSQARAAARDARRQHAADLLNEHKIITFRQYDKDTYFMLHPSTVIPGGWQVSMFDRSGPYSHADGPTLEAALREAFDDRDPKEARPVSEQEFMALQRTPEFIEGTKRVTFIGLDNRIRHEFGYDDEAMYYLREARQAQDIDEAIKILEVGYRTLCKQRKGRS